MKFKVGDQVMILDTLNKPAGTGTIISFNPTGKYYKVNYKYPNSEKAEQADFPQERLITNPDIISSLKN